MPTPPPRSPPSPGHLAAACRIHADLPVVDGHNDLPWALRTGAGGDPSGPLPEYHTDFPRLLAGGVGLQFWSVYVPAWNEAPFATTLEQIDRVAEMSAAGRDQTELVRTAADAERVRRTGRFAGMLGAEGGHSIEGSLAHLRELAGRGVRYLTLTHADTTGWADSATDEPRHGGLAPFGREVVAELNALGMLVDISHVSVETMRDALEVSQAPVIASHSSAYALAPHPRCIPDDMLEGVAASGGVVMVPFVPAFLVAETAKLALDMFEVERQWRAEFEPDEEDAYVAARRERLAALEFDRGRVADVADHIEHIARIAGVDHVGIGSDFDGTEALPEGLADASTYPAITAELLARGWPEPDIRKVLGDNARRVLAAVEA